MVIIVGEGGRNLKTSIKVYDIIYNSSTLSLQQHIYQAQLTNATISLISIKYDKACQFTSGTNYVS